MSTMVEHTLGSLKQESPGRRTGIGRITRANDDPLSAREMDEDRKG